MNPQRILKYFLFFAIASVASFILGISIPRNSVSTSDQPKGQAIHIDRADLSKGGFIVINAMNKTTNLPDENKTLNNPIYLPAGIYKNINVYLNENALIEEKLVSVTLYEDRGTPGTFEVYPDNPDTDVPLKTWDGKLARKVIKVY